MIIKNFITTLKRFTASSVMNVIGLAVAFATAYLILVQVRHDFTFNQSVPDGERIYYLEMDGTMAGMGKFQSWLPRPLGNSICNDNPTVEDFGVIPAGISELISGFGSDAILIHNAETDSYDKVKIKVLGWGVTCKAAEMLGVQLVKGDLSKATEAFVITESAAKRIGLDVGDVFCFGDEWGKGQNSITAIVTDFPKNSDWEDIELFYDIGEQSIDSQSEWSFNHLVKLHSADDVQQFLEVAKMKTREYFSDVYSNVEVPDDVKSQTESMINSVRLISIYDTYFANESTTGHKGSKSTATALLMIAILVIVIAFINFVNFFMAMVPQRIRGVNTHRVYGCSVVKMRLNFIFEAVGLVILGLLFAALIVLSLKSSFIVNYISASIALADNFAIVVAVVGVGLLFAVVATLYPAHYITSFPLALTSKGSFGASKSGQRLRMTLVGVQFVISIALIISASFVKLQHDYMMGYDMGFDKEQLLTGEVPISIVGSFDDRETFASELKKNPQIIDVTFANGSLIAEQRMGWGRWFHEKSISFQCYPVAYNFLDFMKIEMTEGSYFSKADELDTMGVFIFNEKAKNQYDMTLEDKVEGHNGDARIVGFCRDFNFTPLQYDTEPFAFYVFGPKSWKLLSHVYIRTASNANIKEVIDYVKDKVVEMSPKINHEGLDIDFFDKELGRQYEQEQKLATLVTIFSLISILISLIGVFGLVLFETQYRRKEIGLRRVQGAGIKDILLMFNRKFIYIVLICFAIAVPIAYFVIRRYFEGFAYHTRLYWWVFALALLVVAVITMAVVTLRSLRAATENPVKSIRTE